VARGFDELNEIPPACVIQLGQRPPECFEPTQWIEWLKDAWRSVYDDPAKKRQMQRMRPPNHCEDCTASHQSQMLAAGKCNPAVMRLTPLGAVAIERMQMMPPAPPSVVVPVVIQKREAPEQLELFEGF
jgi:hypothetical protein